MHAGTWKDMKGTRFSWSKSLYLEYLRIWFAIGKMLESLTSQIPSISYDFCCHLYFEKRVFATAGLFRLQSLTLHGLHHPVPWLVGDEHLRFGHQVQWFNSYPTASCFGLQTGSWTATGTGLSLMEPEKPHLPCTQFQLFSEAVMKVFTWIAPWGFAVKW